MSLANTVQHWLENDKANGKTHKEMAKRYCVATSYITNLLNGKRSWNGISLGYFDKMFPNARIDLDGSGASSPYQSGSPGAILLNGNHNIAGDGEALRAKIILSILDLDLPPEVQSQILKVIKNA